MVGIVLDIHANHRLGDSVGHSQQPRGSRGDPMVLQVEENGNVAKRTEEPSQSTEILASSHNLEDFSFDFAFKFGIELVPNER